jgi:hypothetical protein
MRSDFAMARRHLEQAHNCLSGDDNLTQKMLTAVGLLIDAALKAEHMADETGKVVAFPPLGADQRGLRWKAKKPFGNRGGSPHT